MLSMRQPTPKRRRGVGWRVGNVSASPSLWKTVHLVGRSGVLDLAPPITNHQSRLTSRHSRSCASRYPSIYVRNDRLHAKGWAADVANPPV